MGIRRWTLVQDGMVTETDPPVELSSRPVVVLCPCGSLFFAAAGMVSDALPGVSTS
jgi:hypothetical protein